MLAPAYRQPCNGRKCDFGGNAGRSNYNNSCFKIWLWRRILRKISRILHSGIINHNTAVEYDSAEILICRRQRNCVWGLGKVRIYFWEIWERLQIVMVYLSSQVRLFGLPCSLTNQILYILQRNCLFFWILLEDRTLKFGTL